MLFLEGITEGHNRQVCTAQYKFSSANAVLPLLTTGRVLVWGINGRHIGSTCSRNVSVLGESCPATLSRTGGCHKVVSLIDDGGRKEYEGVHGGKLRIKLMDVQDV